MNVVKESRCQKLLIKRLPPNIRSYYDDIQKDYAKIMRLLVGWSGIGHLIWDRDGKEYQVVTPESSAASRNATSSNLQKFIEIIGKGGAPATNCYGVFYSLYKPATKIRKDNYIKVFANKLATLTDEDFDKGVKMVVKKYDQVTKEEWTGYRKRLTTGTSMDDVWEEIETKVGNPNKGTRLVALLRQEHVFPQVIRHDDYGYCTALIDMLVAAFSSWIECSNLHQATRDSLQKRSDAAKTDDVFNAMCALAVAFEEANYGLSKKVLFRAIDLVKANKENAFFALACEELSKDQYKILFSSDNKALHAAYGAWKNHRKLNNMKPYISMPKFIKNYQVPFGLTGKGYSFGLSVSNEELSVQIKDSVFVCYRSHYFANLSVEKLMVKDAKGKPKDGNCYSMKFRHKTKDTKKSLRPATYKDWIASEIREVKIQQAVNGKFYLFLPYSINQPEHNYLAERFFKFAAPAQDLIDKLADSLTVAGFDLNISTPLTMSMAVVKKNSSDGAIDALDYGRGDLIGEPMAVAIDTSLSRSIRAFKSDVQNLVGVIREYKKTAKSGGGIEEESQQWLTKEVGSVLCGNIRHQIQIVMKKYDGRYKKFKKRCRDSGHNNLSESVRLLELMDCWNSLRNSYANIHVFGGGKFTHTTLPNSNDARANFRDFVSKQYASIVATSAKSANVVFIEDLDIDFDSDRSGNSITRLFAAGQLKKNIEEACHKVGIGCVFVSPALTSRTDPVTGILGKRDKFNKTCLNVVRDGIMGWLDSDVTASLNVLLVGLNHSVFPRRFKVEDGVIKNGEETPDETTKKAHSKRLARFLAERKVKKLYLTGEAVVTTMQGNSPVNGLVYVTPAGYDTEQQKLQKEKDIDSRVKDLRASNAEIPLFTLRCDPGKTYMGFYVKQVPD